VAFVPESVAPIPVRAAGILPDAVLLRLEPGTALPERHLPQPRPGAGDADAARRRGVRNLSREPLLAFRAWRRLVQLQSELQRRHPAGSRAAVPGRPVRTAAVR